MKKFCKKHSSRAGVTLLITALVATSLHFGGYLTNFLRTSIVGLPEHEPFDGTVYPIEKVPDWVHLSSDKWDANFDSLSSSDLVDIPYYDPSQLSISTDNLTWGNAEHDAIRNAKITYSVAYMGNYLLDGREYAGSHLAVDIKIPTGTPVRAIANGTVIKTSSQSSGFGHHIVIQHNNVPTLDDPDANETIFSSYSHLGDILVLEGTTVKKGDVIGKSASTGTSTTPHLHFQIDTTEAPWHPYWPFTWQDASDAGLDFFSAVNAGLGQENAILTTVNPVVYVQTYLDGNYTPPEITGPSADSNVPDESENEDIEEPEVADDPEDTGEPEITGEPEDTDEPEVVEEPEVVLDPPVLTFEFETHPKYYIGQDAGFTVLLRDQYGNTFENGFTETITISSINGHFTADPSLAFHRDFENGRLECSFSMLEAGRDKVKVVYNGETYYSSFFEIIGSSPSAAFTDVAVGDEYFDAITYLAEEGIIAGYSDGTFRPRNAVTRVEALKLIYEGIRENLSSGDLPFNDVSVSEWYADYLYTAYDNGVVSGYSNGQFRPAQLVNKAEFYKILFNAMGVDVNPNVTADPFIDVNKDAWFAPYVAYAKELGIIDPDIERLRPAIGMSRGEVAYAMYRLMMLMR